MPPVVVAVGAAEVGHNEVGLEDGRALRAGLSCAFQQLSSVSAQSRVCHCLENVFVLI